MGYYYHWMRDGGLCIKTWIEINDNSYEAVRTELEAYAGWVAKETSLNFLFYIIKSNQNLYFPFHLISNSGLYDARYITLKLRLHIA